MFKVGDTVVHKRDICKITEIVKDFIPNEDYYTLIPLENSSLIIHTPISDKRGLIRAIISKDAAEVLLQRISEIGIMKFDDDHILDSRYIALIDSNRHEDLIKIIKTTYLRNADKESIIKKVCEKDKNYFKLAERLLYSELSVTLDKSYQETKEYVENKMSELVK